MAQDNQQGKVNLMLAQVQALECLQREREKLSEMLSELKEDYIMASDPLKVEIEAKAEQTLEKLKAVLEKLKSI